MNTDQVTEEVNEEDQEAEIEETNEGVQQEEVSIVSDTSNTKNYAHHVNNQRPGRYAAGAGIERLDIRFNIKEYVDNLLLWAH